jgi:hypothetical protein
MECQCAGITSKGIRCSFKATQGEFCKKHVDKTTCKPQFIRKIPDLVYHNHAPNQECGKSCPRYNACEAC